MQPLRLVVVHNPEVTKAGDRFDALCVNVEDGLNSQKVGVKAGDHSMFHGVHVQMACCRVVVAASERRSR